MEGFEAREPMAGKGSMGRLEMGLLQNCQIWEAKGSSSLAKTMRFQPIVSCTELEGYRRTWGFFGE